MAVNFPDSPANGDSFSVNDTTYVYNATAGYWDITSTVQASASTGTNAPSNPSSGDLWFDPSSLTTYIYYSDGTSSQWVPANSVGARGAPGPGYPTAYYSVDYTSTATGNVVFNSSSSPTLPSYTVGKVNAWVNGVLRSDIDASDGSNVEISLSTGDEVQIINFGDTDILDPTASSNDHTTYTTLSSLIDTVQANVTSAGSGVAVYATPDLLPLSGTNAGEQAYVNSTNRLYINNGTGWYSISLVNSSPSITSVLDGDSNTTPFTLSTDGSASIITITATDPEDIPLTYTYSVTSGSLSNGGGTTATVVQGTGSNTNKFTVTPSTTEAYAGTFSLTFTASDGINTATSANSFTLNFITIATNSKYTTLLATATGTSDNNNITDSSTNNHSITVNGDAHAGTFSPYRSGGYSTYFDGAGDGLEISDSDDFDLSGGSWTIECWWYPITVNTYDGVFSQWNGPSVASGRNINVAWESDKLYLFAYNGGTFISSLYHDVTASVLQKKWNHIAAVFDGTKTELYLNGQASGRAYVSSTNLSKNVTAPFRVAKHHRLSSYHYSNSYISDLRIVKGTAITPPSGGPTERLGAVTNTSLLTCHLPYIADGSTNDHSITINGNTSTKPFSPYDYNEYSAADNGGSVYFGGGTREHLSTSLPAFGTQDFEVEFWIYGGGLTSTTWYTLFSRDYNVNGSFRIYCSGSGSSADKFIYIANGTEYNYTSAGKIKDNVWNHMLLSRVSGTAKWFINGIEDTSWSDSENMTSTATLYIGDTGADETSSSSYPFVGYMSDIAIRMGGSGYRTSSFTSPTAPLSSTGAELHVKGTDASIIDKSQGDNLKLVGNTTGSTAQVKFSNTKSMYFDGTGDYALISKDTANINTLDNDFTIEYWLYDSSPTTWKYVVVKADNTGNTSASELSFGTGQFTAQTDGKLYFSNTLGAYLAYTNSALSANTWYHIAVVRNNNVFTMYLDGVAQTATTTNNGSVTAVNEDLVLGGHQYQVSTLGRLNGYIQDFRFTKGLARYTANFTPPTASLEG